MITGVFLSTGEGVCLVPGGGVPGGDHPDGYCCGRYASYWNAFLFTMYPDIKDFWRSWVEVQIFKWAKYANHC